MDIKLADALWTMGAGHVIGATALVEQHRKELILASRPVGMEYTVLIADDVEQAIFSGPYSASIHLLVGFAFELLLKTAYLLHGGDPKLLGHRGIGHDLVRALDMAEELGFSFPAADFRSLMERLNATHQKHHFRYGGPRRVTLPALGSTLPVLKVLAEELRDQLNPLLLTIEGRS